MLASRAEGRHCRHGQGGSYKCDAVGNRLFPGRQHTGQQVEQSRCRRQPEQAKLD